MKALAEFINFRELCLENAKTALRSAKELQDKQVNHIAFHLCILSLEEIGKVVICWSSYCNYQKTNLEKPLIIDDHVKKLFWAIWWPLLGQEIPTQAGIDEYKSLASNCVFRKYYPSLFVPNCSVGTMDLQYDAYRTDPLTEYQILVAPPQPPSSVILKEGFFCFAKALTSYQNHSFDSIFKVDKLYKFDFLLKRYFLNQESISLIKQHLVPEYVWIV